MPLMVSQLLEAGPTVQMILVRRMCVTKIDVFVENNYDEHG